MRTVMMTKMRYVLEVWQAVDTSSYEFSHRQNAVSIRIQLLQHGRHDFFCLLSMNLDRSRFLPSLLVMHTVNRLQLVDIENAVTIQVV